MTDADRQDHEEKADELEHELGDMEQRSAKLGDEIESAGDDWERKKGDPAVPGAPEEVSGEEDSGEGDIAADELDFGRDIDSDVIVAEDGPPADDSGEDDSDDSGDSEDSDDSDEDDDSADSDDSDEDDSDDSDEDDSDEDDDSDDSDEDGDSDDSEKSDG